jgi:calcineurin-like phosphoesterase family protein
MQNVYLIGDPHFGHFNIIEYGNRPFKNIEVMDKYMIVQWNKVVSENDIVYLFGDFALCNTRRYIYIAKRLNGKIHLIRGNHDKQSKTKIIKRMGFESVQDSLIYDGLLFTHRPEEDSIYFNIHAHTHNTRINDPKHFCVSTEMLNYRPISFKEVKRRINRLINKF